MLSACSRLLVAKSCRPIFLLTDVPAATLRSVSLVKAGVSLNVCLGESSYVVDSRLLRWLREVAVGWVLVF
jgi:hypothetical protein